MGGRHAPCMGPILPVPATAARMTGLAGQRPWQNPVAAGLAPGGLPHGMRHGLKAKVRGILERRSDG
jgi:hypothetical protein